MIRLSLILSLCHLAGMLMAQSQVPFEKEYFPNDRDGYKAALQQLNEGDEIFEKQDPAFYGLALPHYLAAATFNPNNALLNYRLGVCYLHSPDKRASLGYIEKALALDPSIDPINSNYLLGRGYHLNERWSDAIAAYEAQLAAMQGSEATAAQYAVIKKHIEEAENGRELSAEKQRVWIDNLGPAINSSAPEYAPLISTDEHLLIITARREGSVGGLRDEADNLPFEDLYYSVNQEGTWSALRNLGEGVNTSGHDASSGLAPDGKTLFVFRGTRSGGGDVYYSQEQAELWSKPKALGKYVNSPEHESAVALSYDGNELYFVSEKEGGLGGKDIYLSRWDQEKEEWAEAANLGPMVNSPYDEDGVFIHPDGKRLYFSSQGHTTMGGNDIFYCERVNGHWSNPTNIGYPINTPDDDVFFVVAADGRTAYYSSIRDEGYGEKDIYRITFLGPPKPPLLSVEDQLRIYSESAEAEVIPQPSVQVRTSRMVLLKGLILDDQSGGAVKATIDLVDNETSELLATFTSDAASGAYLVSLPAGRNYGVHVTAENYLFNSLNFDLPDTAEFEQIYKVLRLKKIKIGERIVLRNIFFDYNQHSIRKESEAELQRLVLLLNENPQIKIEISGHTDNVGGEAYNQELSEARAAAVVARLTEMGVAAERLISKGYGKNRPIASNDTPEGRAENRRTEFELIE